MTHSLTLNGVKATIIFHDNTWELTVRIGENNSSTCGLITNESSNPISSPIRYSDEYNFSDADNKHVAYINTILNDVTNSFGKKQKAVGAKRLYDYIANEGLEFINTFNKYKKTIIKKAYELKADSYDVPELKASIDHFLTVIGEPLLDISDNSDSLPKSI